MKKVSLFLLSLITLLLLGCSKEENPNDIPVVAVNFVVNPNSTEYLELNAVNGWVTVTGGYRGIIIFRKSLNEFAAFERACPYDWQQSDARIEVESSGITAICPHCSSKFILLDGSPFNGPSPYPLKPYLASYDGTLLFISN
jgi:nitrite reductase/ring-hydroxylating ferredoxin subunit